MLSWSHTTLAAESSILFFLTSFVLLTKARYRTSSCATRNPKTTHVKTCSASCGVPLIMLTMASPRPARIPPWRLAAAIGNFLDLRPVLSTVKVAFFLASTLFCCATAFSRLATFSVSSFSLVSLSTETHLELAPGPQLSLRPRRAGLFLSRVGVRRVGAGEVAARGIRFS